MGLFTEIVALPLAPVRSVMWVMAKTVEAAEREYYDPTPCENELAALEGALLNGEIDEAEYDRREDELLDRLEEIRAYWNGSADTPGPTR
ncbi:gas vesicle protein GvpG [Streptomyces sp. NPDC058001]|uniref:gas vesicle protein GvpG n=1 Tax=Streptomyces sp. NPDC058001 TaxID=3346300 RepID=UPI0036E8B4E9